MLLGLVFPIVQVICICLGRTEFSVSLHLLPIKWRVIQPTFPSLALEGFGSGGVCVQGRCLEIWIPGEMIFSLTQRGLDSFDSGKDPWVERCGDYGLGEKKSEIWILKVLLVQSSCQPLYRDAETVNLAGSC